MAGLKATDWHAEITWLGVVESPDRRELKAVARKALDLTFAGVAGSVHAGETRLSCSRVTALYDKGTPIRNERQVSIVSEEELAVIAERLGLEALDPVRLGATIVVRGLADLSHVPPASRLQAPSGATLAVDVENGPCNYPARSMEAVAPGHGKGFRSAALGLRGLTGWVAREGRIALGDRLRVFIPDQKPWSPW